MGTDQAVSPNGLTLRYSIHEYYLPQGKTLVDRFRSLRDLGFEGLEMDAREDNDRARRIGDAAREAGVQIQCVHAGGTYTLSFATSRPAEIKALIRGTLTAIRNAHDWGAYAILLIPAIVDGENSYLQAYERSQKIIRDEIVPVAKALGVTIAVENVWSGFLIGPLEYVKYIDEFDSPYVRAFLDVGNMIFGNPEHWVRMVGKRTVRMHAKDFHLSKVRMGQGYYSSRKIGNGSIDWRAVSQALADVGYNGWVTNAWPVGAFSRGMLRAGALGRSGRSLAVVGTVAESVQKAVLPAELRDARQRMDRFLRAPAAVTKAARAA